MIYEKIPEQLTSFIGRERELAEIQSLLTTARLVTITGPGGSGKTRLAVQAATIASSRFTNGAHFVSLAAINDPTLIISALAEVMGLTELPARLLFDSLKDYLRERQMLLLLDNFEQLIPAAPLLSELLLAAENLKLLVTSREALKLRTEQVFPLAPMEFLDRTEIFDQISVKDLSQYASIQLFVDRAKSIQPDFEMTSENSAAVAEICARLDGLPLAVELAAARIKLLPPQVMLEKLKQSPLQLLTRGAHDAPKRQRTLRDTVQWSYELLNTGEQQAFRILSVFNGGCMLEAAEALIKGQEQVSQLDLLSSLVNKNLLRRTGTDNEPRLEMLETIRQFGLEELEEMSELEALREAHANYYLSLAEETEPLLTGQDQKTWLQQLEGEQGNFRAALRWGSDLHAAELKAEFLLRLTAALRQFWFLRGFWSECRRWLEEAIFVSSTIEVDQALRAKVLYLAVQLVLYQGDLERAQALCEQSVSLYRQLDNGEGLLAALLQLCRTLDYRGDEESLQVRAQEALALAEEMPDLPIKAQAFQELSFINFGNSSLEMEKIAHYLDESERIYRTLEDQAGLAYTFFAHAGVLEQKGDEIQAQAFYAQAEKLVGEVDDHRLQMIMISRGMNLSWRRGDYASVRLYFERLLAHQASVGLNKYSLDMLASSLHKQGNTVWAARVYGLADNSVDSGPRKRITRHSRESLLDIRSEVRTQLGEDAFSKALVEGRSLTVSDLLAIPHPSPLISAPKTDSPLPIEPLTARELEVLHLLPLELSNPQIAERLVISRRTVDAHLRSIYGKLGVHSRHAAIQVGVAEGLLEN